MQTYSIIDSIANHQHAVRILKDELMGKCFKFLCYLSNEKDHMEAKKDTYDENVITFEPISIELDFETQFDISDKHGIPMLSSMEDDKEQAKTHKLSIEAIRFVEVDDNKVRFTIHKNKTRNTSGICVMLVCDKDVSPWSSSSSQDYWRVFRNGLDINTGKGVRIDYKFKQPDY